MLLNQFYATRVLKGQRFITIEVKIHCHKIMVELLVQYQSFPQRHQDFFPLFLTYALNQHLFCPCFFQRVQEKQIEMEAHTLGNKGALFPQAAKPRKQATVLPLQQGETVGKVFEVRPSFFSCVAKSQFAFFSSPVQAPVKSQEEEETY